MATASSNTNAFPSDPNAGAPDWTKLPVPKDDGEAAHLTGMQVPDIPLPSTKGGTLSLASLAGRCVLFAFPRPGQPLIALSEWDQIPGARGCTPHSCAFRDKLEQFRENGVTHVIGLATQNIDYLRDWAETNHLPFPVLSDEALALTEAMRLPNMEVVGQRMIKRLAMVIDAGRVSKVFYPVFPPDKNADEVLDWLRDEKKNVNK